MNKLTQRIKILLDNSAFVEDCLYVGGVDSVNQLARILEDTYTPTVPKDAGAVVREFMGYCLPRIDWHALAVTAFIDWVDSEARPALIEDVQEFLQIHIEDTEHNVHYDIKDGVTEATAVQLRALLASSFVSYGITQEEIEHITSNIYDFSFTFCHSSQAQPVPFTFEVVNDDAFDLDFMLSGGYTSDTLEYCNVEAIKWRGVTLPVSFVHNKNRVMCVINTQALQCNHVLNVESVTDYLSNR